MNEVKPLFLLVGNGPYDNKGCEAIVRGTTKILRDHFNDPRFICLSHFLSEEQYQEQRIRETDKSIVHLASCMFNKNVMIQNYWKPETWYRGFQYFFDRNSFYYRDMLPYIDEASAVISVGGDNYSLDYGIPTRFTSLDDLVLAHKKPIAIWGASVGPFNAIPDYERYMSDHLKKITMIFARESATVGYLKSIGVSENVHPVADPAFLMDPVKPKEEIPIEEGSIGLNLSPLMAKYVTGGDVEQWTALTAAIIDEVARGTERQVYLIPHVTNPDSNDYIFMKSALSRIPGNNENITLISSQYTAAETKWIIDRMALFAGARTHATIASLSSCVPTLSFAYSVKAQGINRDVFGHTDYCLDPKDLDSKRITARIKSMLNQDAAIRTILHQRIPNIQKSARNSGKILKHLIEEN
jgi:polysaccharide pyruvyl transferase WcaK-like protein